VSPGGTRAILVGAKNNQVKSTLSAAGVCGNRVVLRAKKQETDCASDRNVILSDAPQRNLGVAGGYGTCWVMQPPKISCGAAESTEIS
jgi:hypothetical protein